MWSVAVAIKCHWKSRRDATTDLRAIFRMSWYVVSRVKTDPACPMRPLLALVSSPILIVYPTIFTRSSTSILRHPLTPSSTRQNRLNPPFQAVCEAVRHGVRRRLRVFICLFPANELQRMGAIRSANGQQSRGQLRKAGKISAVNPGSYAQSFG